MRPSGENGKTTNEVYEAIIWLTNKKGYPPTYQEIVNKCGLSTKSLVVYHVKRLSTRGILRLAGRPRGFLFTGEALEALSNEQVLNQEQESTIPVYQAWLEQCSQASGDLPEISG